MNIYRFSEIKVVACFVFDESFSDKCNQLIKDGFLLYGEPKVLTNSSTPILVQYFVNLPKNELLPAGFCFEARCEGIIPDEFNEQP